MTNLSRRQILQLGAAGLLLGNGLAISSAHAEGGTVTIAYNVNLPSWDPTTGLSAVNPTIQSIYRSVFDQFIGQKPTPGIPAGPAHRMGLDGRQEAGVDDGARRRQMA